MAARTLRLRCFFPPMSPVVAWLGVTAGTFCTKKKRTTWCWLIFVRRGVLGEIVGGGNKNAASTPIAAAVYLVRSPIM